MRLWSVVVLVASLALLAAGCDGESASSGNTDLGGLADLGGPDTSEPDLTGTPDLPGGEDTPAQPDLGQDLGGGIDLVNPPGDGSTDSTGPDVAQTCMPPCDDGNACTQDRCNPETGACEYEAVEGGPCDDDDACTTDDLCVADGVCAGTPLVCDDGNACTADWCEAGVCRSQGGVAGGPMTLDGLLDDYVPASLLSTNTIPTDVEGAVLSSLRVQVAPEGLWFGVAGSLPDDAHAWVLFLDLDPFGAEPTGAADPGQIVAGLDSLLVAGSRAASWEDSSFSADLLVGSVGQIVLSEAESSPYGGCRDLSSPESPTTLPCGVATRGNPGGFEVFLPWSSLPGGALSAGETLVWRGHVQLLNAQTGARSNQRLPGGGEGETPQFLSVAAGGACLSPFCGDEVVDFGEECDDGNDITDDDCNECSVPPWAGMVFVPAGRFIMGASGAGFASPPHEVTLGDFYIDRYETTNAEFAAFLNARGDHMGASGQPLYDCETDWADILCLADGVYEVEPGRENHPVGETWWEGAALYCEWVGKRLPTEAEWEKAARGPESTADSHFYPWGDDFEAGWLNCLESVCADGWELTAPIGSYPENVSYYGAYDMAGNVWEWVADWFDPTYYATSPSVNPRGPCDGAPVCGDFTARSVRGGGWDDNQERTTSIYRYSSTGSCNADIGIRCAKSFLMER